MQASAPRRPRRTFGFLVPLAAILVAIIGPPRAATALDELAAEDTQK